eukprot:9713-Heterococcus_DN1.PRE.1
MPNMYCRPTLLPNSPSSALKSYVSLAMVGMMNRPQPITSSSSRNISGGNSCCCGACAEVAVVAVAAAEASSVLSMHEQAGATDHAVLLTLIT